MLNSLASKVSEDSKRPIFKKLMMPWKVAVIMNYGSRWGRKEKKLRQLLRRNKDAG
jgi:hypothetical protein